MRVASRLSQRASARTPGARSQARVAAEIRRIESEAKSDIGRLERTGKTDEEKAKERQKLIERAEAKIEDRITELREQREAAGR